MRGVLEFSQWKTEVTYVVPCCYVSNVKAVQRKLDPTHAPVRLQLINSIKRERVIYILNELDFLIHRFKTIFQ